MAQAKTTFELKQNLGTVTSAVTTLPGGKQLELTADSPSYATSDPGEISTLQGWDAVKVVDTPKKEDRKDGK